MGSVNSKAVSPPLVVPPVINEKIPNQNDKKQDQSSGLFSNIASLRNPGTVEELSKQCKDVFPTNFEGCKMIFNKGISSHFQISHTINMTNLTPAGYRFGATYVGTNMLGPNEAYPILLGDLDSSGNLNANIHHQFHPRLKSKLVAQFQDNKCAVSQLTSDYKGDSYTASCTLVNLDIINKSGIAVGQLLKNFTPKVDLGLEIAAQAGPQIPGGSATSMSLVGRYTSSENNSVLSGSVQPNAIGIHYYKKIQENLQAGVEMETNLAMGETSAAFGYQIDVPKADLTFRGSLDTNWQVGAVLEKRLQPLPLTFTLSGAIDHGAKQQNYKFGCGIIIG